MRSSVHCVAYSGSADFRIASTASLVQYMQSTAMTTWPGQSVTHLHRVGKVHGWRVSLYI